MILFFPYIIIYIKGYAKNINLKNLKSCLKAKIPFAEKISKIKCLYHNSGGIIKLLINLHLSKQYSFIYNLFALLLILVIKTIF